MKCPSCGALINFEPNSQKMVCPYCDTELDIEAMKQYDEAIKDSPEETSPEWTDSKTAEEWKDAELYGFHSYVCTSCGGEIIGDENTVATMCPYCGNNAIIANNLKGQYKPEIIIPFKVDKDTAKSAFKAHLVKKPLLPSKFKTDAFIDKINGIYVPFWLYNCTSDAKMRFKATRTQFWSDSKYNYTRTSHYCLVRNGNMSFESVPVDGSSKIDNDFMESLEPYDYTQAVDFKTAYLSGYLADKYDVSSDDCSQRANERIKNSTAAKFTETAVGYSTCIPEYSNISITDQNVKYALLPVWTMVAKYGDKDYRFMMNGQTKKFVGELPVSKLKMLLWFLSVFIGVGAIITLLLQLL